METRIKKVSNKCGDVVYVPQKRGILWGWNDFTYSKQPNNLNEFTPIAAWFRPYFFDTLTEAQDFLKNRDIASEIVG